VVVGWCAGFRTDYRNEKVLIMTEFYRKFIGRDLSQMVKEGDCRSIRNMVLFDLVSFMGAGIVLGILLVRAGWVPI
jgi:hypothetical protein